MSLIATSSGMSNLDPRYIAGKADIRPDLGAPIHCRVLSSNSRCFSYFCPYF